MTIRRVTNSGKAEVTAVSPDGRYVVYSIREGETVGLNVRQIATGSDVLILPPDEVFIYSLTFSRDGNYIDYIRSEKNNPASTFLYRIPTLGGTPRLVMQRGVDFSTSYSPDGAQFAFLRVGDRSTINLLIANADGTNERVLATSPYLEPLAHGVAWSPDGKMIAFTGSESEKNTRSALRVVSVADGSIREIYSTPNIIGHPRWLPDGSGLLAPIANINRARGQLWFISFPKGLARRLTNDLMDYELWSLDLTQDGRTLVETAGMRISDLWIIPAGDTTKGKQVTRNNHAVGRFSWTTDGRIFFSNDDGSASILSSDGNTRTLLTSSENAIWNPFLCPDGRYIVYSAYRDQKVGLWRMEADGSNPIRIADETVAPFPQCSPDTQWVIYLRRTSLMRVTITGEKSPEPIGKNSAVYYGNVLAFSPDGKRIAYLAPPESPDVSPGGPSRSQPNQLKVIAFDGGALLQHFDWPATAGEPRWSPMGDAIEYVLTRNGVSNIWRRSLAGGTPKQITHFDSGQIFDFDWSRDGKLLALTRGTQSSDVILISNFR